MTKAAKKDWMFVGFIALAIGSVRAEVTFQIVLSGTLDTAVTAPGGMAISLDLMALTIRDEDGVLDNLDSFTYRTTFPNEEFTLNSNLFADPFDNVQVPGGFNGSIPWDGLPIQITNDADAGSPFDTPSVADLYRTTATTSGSSPPTDDKTVIETFEIVIPLDDGVYPVSLNVLEAADSNGAFHTTSNGVDFVITVPEPGTAILFALLALGGLVRRR